MGAGFALPANIGTIKRVAGADPAASNEVSDTVPSGKFWVLISVSVQLVQGATQTPFPSLVVDDGANILFQAFAGTAALSAGTTAQVSWGVNVPPVGSAASTVLTGPLADNLVLLAGYRIRTVTTGIGANTNYGVPSYFVFEGVTGAAYP
jgi:hypothetical protein